jgi:hypothetical protein
MHRDLGKQLDDTAVGAQNAFTLPDVDGTQRDVSRIRPGEPLQYHGLELIARHVDRAVIYGVQHVASCA